ncbi:FAD-dependent oxidoreductase [Cyanobacterium aponinum AL20118]|uniref:FAD-dependent oxidoreductase n=1 Tax=Cyanobacterium aponinum AL20115 TaxID=3090662 RepID=A0AAF1BZY1_9CHRO|nr:FAD-dependent oxidoreductase [Cyanobacterium aponinum]WPF86992.1 FAD-dependent oxidoreductase [Cyanobacterium aponinum AL20115]
MINRRFFLIVSSVILAHVVASKNFASNSLKTTKKNKEKIIIIGAGIAGLTAGKTLQNQGFEVILLEARNRIGGRLWTSKKWDNAFVDMGASWIHGEEGNPITKLANTINAQVFSTKSEKSIIYDLNGKEIIEDKEEKLDKLTNKLKEIINKIQNNYYYDISLQKALEKELKWQTLSDVNKQYLEYLLNSNIEQEYAADISQLSAFYFDESNEFDGDDLLFVKGYNVISDYLAQGLNIKLNHTVEAIGVAAPSVNASNSQGVNVITNKSNFQADRVIVTLPLGVLQKNIVKFSPALPEKKLEAINQLGMGVLNKLYVLFPKRFWQNNYDWIGKISEKKGQWSEWVNLESALKKPILLGFNAGKFGKEIESWSDEEIIADAMKTLRQIYGNSIPQPIDYQLTRWSQDPFTFGSYSYYATNSTPNHRQELAKPINKRVFFAGEATSIDYPATVHGAYFSGLRVSQEIIALMN